MDNFATIIWKGKEIGKATNIIMDMWYLDADWEPNPSDETSEFQQIASQLKADDVIKAPFKGIVTLLRYDDVASIFQNILILTLDESKILMRIISDELAAYADLKLLSPWQQSDNPSIYEEELKKELSFLHPLNWKKVRTIGNRSDRDDVLFEILNGSSKYAVVHLTWTNEHSRKFPLTHFYKDWKDLYENCLLKDNKKWKEDNQ